MKHNPTVNDARHHFWGIFHRASDLTERYMDAVLIKEVGVTYQQFLVMMAIDTIGNKATVGDIAERLDRTQNTISVLLERMKRDGLIRKARNMTDRRMVRVAVTDKGKEKLMETFGIGAKIFDDLLQPLSEEDISTLITLLGKVEQFATEKFMALKIA